MDWRKEVRATLIKKTYNVHEEMEKNVKGGNENEDDEVDEIDTELSEEAQKLKRKKRKVAKEKKKIEERLTLKMVIKNDQLVQEEQDLFNLKNIRKASQLNSIKDVEPDHDDDYQVDLDAEAKAKKRRIQVDKDSDEKYFDPDDSDGAESDHDDDEEMNLSEVEDQVDDDDDDNENGILVDLEDKDEKVKSITKMFFENKIFNRLGSHSGAQESNENDLDDDDDIELEELKNRISNVTNGKAKANASEGQKEKANKSAKPTRKVTFDDDDDESNSLDSEDEEGEKGQGSQLNGKSLTPEELALGAMMIKSKKAKRDLLDNGWNRFVHEDDDLMPSWFRKEEQTYYRKPVPVSSEMVKEYNDKLRDINSRPIKKVMEAKARKKKRTIRRLEKARMKAETVTDEADMTNKEKAQYIRR